MGKETGLSKREQQTARRKLLSLGVIAIMRGGFRNTYHSKVMWEKLYQVIPGMQRSQTVPAEPVQNVTTQPPEWQQNVSTKWKQNVATHYRENNREEKETETTDQSENQETWDKAVEQVKKDYRWERQQPGLLAQPC